MRTRRIWTRYLAIGAGLVLVSGCSSADPPTMAQFRNDANAICRTVRHDVGRLPGSDASNPRRMYAIGNLSLAMQRRGVRDLTALTAPKGAQSEISQWLASTTRTIDAATRSLRAQESGDVAAASRANTEGAAHAARADDQARGLGLGACVGARR